jgi:hypothetical protein
MRLGPATRAAVALGVGFAGLFSLVGADARWLGALGAAIVRDRAIPHGVPFAADPTGSWPNVPALSELVFHGLLTIGMRGLLVAQLAAVAVALVVVARDAAVAGARDGAIALAVLVVLIGAFPAFAIIRVQLFSLALFPVLMSLLRAESRAPGRRIWLALPLLILWSNLHGAVLTGLAVLLIYLTLERSRRSRVEALAVAVAGVLACCATPALERTPRYYEGVLRNIEAQRGIGLWSPLSLTRPFDIVLAVAGLTLLGLAWRARPRLWELAALLALALVAVHAQRSGVWLLLAAAPTAATGLPNARAARARVTSLAALAGLAIAGVALGSGPGSTGASPALVALAVRDAAGTPVLAEDVLAEQVALAGGKIVIGNPIDAFTRHDQSLYLDWVVGKQAGDVERADVRVVLVARHGSAERRVRADRRFVLVERDARAALFVRRAVAS